MNNIFIKSLTVVVILICSMSVKGQKAVTVAFDPLTTVALGGYEVELGVNAGNNRITASYLSGNLSPWFGDVADYNTAKHDVLELAWSRFLNTDQRGLSYGLAYAYYTDFTMEDAQGQILSKNPSRVSLKLAYTWFPFSAIPLYLEPSMTFGFMIGDEDLAFSSNQLFEKKSFIGNGPLFNIGYRFDF